MYFSHIKKSHTPNHLYARKTINNYFQDGQLNMHLKEFI